MNCFYLQPNKLIDSKRMKPNLICLVMNLFLFLFIKSDDTLLSQQFFTNHLTDSDLSTWTLTGNNLPSDHFFTTCAGEQLFGGYKVFGGDPVAPTKINRLYSGLIGHYAIRIQAKIYKIDSWNNERLYVMADNTAQTIFLFNSSSSTTNLCGDSNPVFDSINTNYNDSIVLVDVTFNHNAATLSVSFQTDIKSDRGWWGIKNLKVSILLCDKSCKTCANATSCITCDSTVPGLALVGAYCACTTVGTIIQKYTNCLIMPCVTCTGTCSPGYYSSGSSVACLPCNVACATCTGPQNGNSLICITCAAGYYRTNPLTQQCFNCAGGCASCTSLASTSCTSCLYGFFLSSNQCFSSCPIGLYSQQLTHQCYLCSTSCYTCNGPTTNYCTSCTGVLYLNGNQCLVNCAIPYYKWSNTCLQQCPAQTFTDNINLLCVACGANCQQCDSTQCVNCMSTFYIYGGNCLSACPLQFYASNQTYECLACHTDCLSCFGPTSSSCIFCSNPSYKILNSVCYPSCPNSTYSSLCIPCDSNCLQCSGPLSNQCTSCKSPEFLDLKTFQCLAVCQDGCIVDKVNFTCTYCPDGFTGVFHQCQPCSYTCKTCYGQSFLQCLTCSVDSYIKSSTCILLQETQIIKSSAPDISSSAVDQAFFIIFLLISLPFELILVYKTPLLPTIQFMQILSYFYLLSIPMSGQVQRVLLFFYKTNFSTLLQISSVSSVQNLPVKIRLMNKSGHYCMDTLGLHIFIIGATIILLLLKKLQSTSVFTQFIYLKCHPFILTYLYRLFILDQFFSLIIFFLYGQYTTTLGIISVVIIAIDVIAVALTFFWKVKPQDKHEKTYALFYFNQLGESIINKQIYGDKLNKQQIKENLLHNFIYYIGKLPFVLTILYFVQNGTYQAISLVAYSILYLLIISVMPYKRKIFKVLYILGASMVALSSCLYLAMLSNQYVSVGLEIIWLIYVLGNLLVVLFQVFVNFRYFWRFFKYTKYRIQFWVQKLFQQSQASSIHQEKDQSSITEKQSLQQKSNHQVNLDNKGKNDYYDSEKDNSMNNLQKQNSNVFDQKQSNEVQLSSSNNQSVTDVQENSDKSQYKSHVKSHYINEVYQNKEDTINENDSVNLGFDL